MKNHEFKDGDLVKIKQEWLDSPGERRVIYVVLEINEVTKQCIIAPTTGEASKLPLVPKQVVSLEHIEYTGFNALKF